MTQTLTIHVGRVRTTPDGLFELRLPDGVIVRGPGGEGMTNEEAEQALDNLEQMQAMRNEPGGRQGVSPRS